MAFCCYVIDVTFVAGALACMFSSEAAGSQKASVPVRSGQKKGSGTPGIATADRIVIGS
jgi:hypothetical protein